MFDRTKCLKCVYSIGNYYTDTSLCGDCYNINNNPKFTLNKVRGFEPVSEEHRVYPWNIPCDVRLPKRATKNSAAYDFYSPEGVCIEPYREVKLITNVKAYMQPDEVLVMHVRSSIGIKKGLTLSNTTGVIDSDYYNNKDNDGNICICLRNNTDNTVKIDEGERVVQGIFMKYLIADGDETTAVREGGVGSSGA